MSCTLGERNVLMVTLQGVQLRAVRSARIGVSVTSLSFVDVVFQSRCLD